MATIKTTFDLGQVVIFYDPNNCRILPGTIIGISYFKNLDSQEKETYYIKPNNSPFSIGPCPIDFVFKDKDSVLDFCVKLMKDIEEL